MNPMKIGDIVKATGGTLLCGDPETAVTAICTDTRQITPGSLFVPIVGEHFDAHDFIPSALSGGCAASLTARPASAGDKPLIAVADTRRALGDLAAFYRQQFHIPVLAVVGSVGKTTVKELTAAALSRRLRVLKTTGNLNNEIGLPLTLFRLDSSHQAAIAEMGMSGFGEIDTLARIAAPNIGIVTNIGLSHIEMLGSQENIYRAKSELFPHISPGGTVIINGDDPILFAHRQDINCKVITVGLAPENDLTATDIRSGQDCVSFTAIYGSQQAAVNLQFPGEHNVINALLACAAALCLGIPLSEAACGLEAYKPNDKRMQLIDCGGITIINDCYNAAPASVVAALKVLCARPGRKIAVLGDIKELGSFTESAHRDIGHQAAALGVDALFSFGENARWIARAAEKEITVHHFDEIATLNKSLAAYIRPGDTVLVKASRAMRLERVTEFLISTLTKHQ